MGRQCLAMEGERSHIPDSRPRRRKRRSFRNTKLGVGAAGILSVLTLSGEPAEQPSSQWMALQDVPAHVGNPDVTFLGDKDPDLIESYYFAQQVADWYWGSLGYEGSDCDGELKVKFTDEFADPNDTTPNREPAGWANPEICEEWLNSEELADNLWGMAYTHTHEKGHLMELDHSEDRDSLMYGDDKDNDPGNEPPIEATAERFERMFDVEMESHGSDPE